MNFAECKEKVSCQLKIILWKIRYLAGIFLLSYQPQYQDIWGGETPPPQKTLNLGNSLNLTLGICLRSIKENFFSKAERCQNNLARIHHGYLSSVISPLLRQVQKILLPIY